MIWLRNIVNSILEYTYDQNDFLSFEMLFKKDEMNETVTNNKVQDEILLLSVTILVSMILSL